MKRVVLVRHAKAVQYGYEDDFNRDLTGRGRDDADMVSNHLKSQGIVPDLIVASPANRAWQTAEIFAGNFGISVKETKAKGELYHGITTGELTGFLQTLSGNINTVFLFGHNPSFEFYAHGLCADFYREMPTSSAVVIDFDVQDWKEVAARSGKFFSQVNPKSLIS